MKRRSEGERGRERDGKKDEEGEKERGRVLFEIKEVRVK